MGESPDIKGKAQASTGLFEKPRHQSGANLSGSTLYSDRLTLGGVPREQEMLTGHLPRVIYHQVTSLRRKTDPPDVSPALCPPEMPWLNKECKLGVIRVTG
jgi:hypothetical protein